MTSPDRIRVGTSGHQYEHWRGVLYAEGLPKRSWLRRYCERFDTVEINNTFYSLPSADTFDEWRATVPPGFRFATKLSRFATQAGEPDMAARRGLPGVHPRREQ